MWDSRMTGDVERIIGSGAPDRALEDEAPPSVLINPHSDLGKELRKWEQHFGHLTPPGTRPGNPYAYREYPKMLYRAEAHPETGQPTCMKARPNPYEFAQFPDRESRAQAYADAVMRSEQWNINHQTVVPSEDRARIAIGQGWCETPTAALEAFELRQQEIARAAAEANAATVRMTAQAQQEWKAAAETTEHHVVDVQPKKRGRKPKVITSV